MSAAPDYAAALEAMTRAMAAEIGCLPEDFFRTGVSVFRLPADGGDPALRRHFPVSAEGFRIVCLGPGAVVGAGPAVLDLARTLFEGVDVDGVFAADRIAHLAAALEPHGLRCFGPVPRLLCGGDGLVRREPPPEIELWLEPEPSDERIAEVGRGAWPNAVRPRPLRPTSALAFARERGALVGVAGLSRDSATLWQVGLDVAAPARRRGIGAALTAAVTEHALAREAHPYYSAGLWNVPSIRTAISAGYRLAFHEVSSYPAPPEESRA